MRFGYYVTVIRGKRVGYLAGPFCRHDDALSAVDGVRRLANELDPWTDFDAFGTACLTTNNLPLGKLNSLVPVDTMSLVAYVGA